MVLFVTQILFSSNQKTLDLKKKLVSLTPYIVLLKCINSKPNIHINSNCFLHRNPAIPEPDYSPIIIRKSTKKNSSNGDRRSTNIDRRGNLIIWGNAARYRQRHEIKCPSCLETHAGFFRLSMKGKFDVYLL